MPIRQIAKQILPILCALLFACAGRAPQPAVPAVPAPPKNPWAWVPEDALAMGQLRTAPFRATRIWQWLEQARKVHPESGELLIDIDRVEFVAFGLKARSEDDVGGVGALEGAWGDGYLGIRAAQRGIAPEQHGLLAFYRTKTGIFAQVNPNLLLVCSEDFIPWLEKRATEGDAVRAFESPAVQSVGARIGLAEAHLAVIADDPQRARDVRNQTQQAPMWIQKQLESARHMGGAVVMGPSTQVALVVETSDSERGKELAAEAETKLRGLSNDMFMRMFGFANLFKVLQVAQDGAFVSVRGELPEADVTAAVDKVMNMLDMADSFRRRQGPEGDAPAQSAP